MADVTVLGIGRMGAAMARALAAAGHSVTVWNRTPAAAEALEGECRVASTAAAAVADSDIVIATLASGAVTEAVLLSDDVRASLRPGAVVMDMGTSGVATAHALAEGLRGVRFVDAPVSGSVATIAAGQLLVMASGDESGVDDARAVLAAFAKKVVHLGPAGAGQAMKLSVNLVVHTLNSAVSEALALAVRAGVPADRAYDVFQDSVVAAPFVLYKRPAFLDEDAPVAMSLALVAKDLGLITAFADSLDSPAPTTRAVLGEVTEAVEAGLGDRDMAALARYLLGAT